MIGYDIACKYGLSYNDNSLIDAYEIVGLLESYEAGEIINDFWLIVHDDIFGFRGVFDKGMFVKIIDLRYFSIFGTDKNYDNREDLEKLGTEKFTFTENNIRKDIDVNIYKILP